MSTLTRLSNNFRRVNRISIEYDNPVLHKTADLSTFIDENQGDSGVCALTIEGNPNVTTHQFESGKLFEIKTFEYKQHGDNIMILPDDNICKNTRLTFTR